jgi:GT2 family glycosyltransferase
LFTCSGLSAEKAIVSGIVESHDKTETLYGGSDKNKKLLLPDGTLQVIRNMNGNIVLVPSAVFKVLGNLDPVYHHDLGDVDYGLRAIESGFSVVTTRVAIGSGDKNDFCRVRLPNSSLINRFKRLYSPLGNHPAINFYFRRKHFGIMNALIYYVHIHLINLLPYKIVLLLYGTRYK